MKRKAKIVATLGPASSSPAVIDQLVDAGLNVARLNFSHGTHAQHAEVIAAIRSTAARKGVPLGVLQDLQGPKLRLGKLAEPVALAEAQVVRLYVEGDPAPRAAEVAIPVGFVELFASVSPGDRILVDEGRLSLEVLETAERTLRARVVAGGTLTSNKGINLPGVRLAIPGFTPKDRADLTFGLAQRVDLVAISFVRTAEDVVAVRQALDECGDDRYCPLLIAKLERPEALENLASILQVADGVMVARGDLGVEMPPESVPLAQKRIITAANRAGKIVITATQMLDSMIANPLPTRAEASDVANSIFDGTDAVMLSGETASGAYPRESVAMMARIVSQAEIGFAEWGHVSVANLATSDDAASIARAARELAHDLNVAAIAVYTHTGRSALLLSKARARVPILALTPEEETYRRLALFWGVVPRLVPRSPNLREIIAQADVGLLESGMAAPGQQAVVVAGFPVSAVRAPNLAFLHNVGEKL